MKQRGKWGVALMGGLLAGALPWSAVAQSNIAVVHRLMLDEQAIIQPPGADGRPAEIADLLNHNDFILTSANTRASVRFTDDGSLLRVNPNARVQIRAEGEAGSLSKTLELEFGELWARVQGQEGREFRVQTPAGVAAVKGTEFIVRVDEDGQTTVITLEGLLEFFNDVGTIDIPAGFRTVVASAAVAPAIEPVPAAQLQELAGLAGTADGSTTRPETMEIRIPGVDAQGQPRTIILQVPRDQVGTQLTPGGGE